MTQKNKLLSQGVRLITETSLTHRKNDLWGCFKNYMPGRCSSQSEQMLGNVRKMAWNA